MAISKIWKKMKWWKYRKYNIICVEEEIILMKWRKYGNKYD